MKGCKISDEGIRRIAEITQKKGVDRDLEFAGYEFTSGPGGTRIHRDVVDLASEFSSGDRVTYKDVNLYDYEGTVDRVDGQWVYVTWDKYLDKDPTKEWDKNLALL